MISNRFDDPLEVRNDPKGTFVVIFLNFKRHFHIRAETAILRRLNFNLFCKRFDLNGVLSSQVTRWRCRIISYSKSRDKFRVIPMRNRRIPDFKTVFDQKFIFLSHVTSWWCPELSPPDTLVIFNRLFFVFKNEIMDRRRKFLSLQLGSVFFGWRHQFSGPRRQLNRKI